MNEDTRRSSDRCGARESLERVASHLDRSVAVHAALEFTNPVLRAVFIDRGGHAPGEPCSLTNATYQPEGTES